MYCYIITNIVNDKKYVGVTTQTIDGRWAQHCKAAKSNKQSALYSAIRKYGKQSFVVEAIDSASCLDDLFIIEKREIIARGTKAPLGYNMTTGGEGTIGLVLSAEVRAKMSASKVGKPKSDAHRAAMRKPKSAEHRAKIAAANMGHTHAPETLAAMRAAAKGRKPSPQAIAATKLARTGVKASLETRLKMSAWQVGRTMSPETRAKISAARRAMRGKVDEHQRNCGPNS